jgi:hypothetical protein
MNYGFHCLTGCVREREREKKRDNYWIGCSPLVPKVLLIDFNCFQLILILILIDFNIDFIPYFQNKELWFY